MPSRHTFKVGDWVLSEFVLKQVKSMVDDRVNGVSDGFFETGGYDLRDHTFPLTMRGKIISAEYERVYKDLHAKGGRLNLNYPDILNWLVDDWVKTMSKQDDDDAVKAGYERLEAFHHAVLNGIDAAQSMTVQDIRLFR